MAYHSAACTCGTCKVCIKRRQAKRNRILAAQGRPSLIKGEEAEAAFAKLRDFHERGMAMEHIGRAAVLSGGNVHAMITGWRADRRHPGVKEPVTGLRRTTLDKINALEFEHTDSAEGGGYGPLRDISGTRRMLQALMLEGFITPFLCGELGWGSGAFWPRVLPIQLGGYQWIADRNVRAASALYEKLDGADPKDFGIRKTGSSKCRNAAERWNAAPRMCWDDDTIHDPDAIPEYTGMCGTVRGYKIHQESNILMKDLANRKRKVMCIPCREARSEHGRGALESYDKFEMMELFDSGKSMEDVARELNVTPWTLRRARKAMLEERENDGPGT